MSIIRGHIRAIITNGASVLEAFVAKGYRIHKETNSYVLYGVRGKYGVDSDEKHKLYKKVRLPIDKTILLTLEK